MIDLAKSFDKSGNIALECLEEGDPSNMGILEIKPNIRELFVI
jgi:hypothetical protein